MYRCIQTLYKIRGQPLYKGQNAGPQSMSTFRGPTVFRGGGSSQLAATWAFLLSKTLALKNYREAPAMERGEEEVTITILTSCLHRGGQSTYHNNVITGTATYMNGLGKPTVH